MHEGRIQCGIQRREADLPSIAVKKTKAKDQQLMIGSDLPSSKLARVVARPHVAYLSAPHFLWTSAKTTSLVLTLAPIIQMIDALLVVPEARLAQSAERKALNLVVVGSSPTVGV